MRRSAPRERRAAHRLWSSRRLACLLALAVCLSPGPPGAAAPQSNKRLRGRVSRVFDGSSFQLGEGLRSSLSGVAAPRLSARGGREAFDFLRRLIEGKTVLLEIDKRLVDAYGRPEYYVFLEDGTFVNVLVLLRGFGRAVVKHPNIRYRSRLIEAEKTAKAFHRGIWGDEFPDPENPSRNLPPRRVRPLAPVWPGRRFP